MRTQSIERFAGELRNALKEGNWDWAERCGERLKLLLLEAAIDDDSASVAKIEFILADAGEVLELSHRLPMHDSPEAAAWRLRADAGTATLATRIRPPKPAADRSEEGVNLRERILKLLREANKPIANNAIAARVGKDQPAVSRALKCLTSLGLIRQWRVGKNLLNCLTDKGRGVTVDPVDNLAAGRRLIAAGVQIKRVPPAVPFEEVPALSMVNPATKRETVGRSFFDPSETFGWVDPQMREILTSSSTEERLQRVR